MQTTYTVWHCVEFLNLIEGGAYICDGTLNI